MFESKYKTAYRDIYDFHKKYDDAVSDEEWNALIDDYILLAEKYKESKYVAKWLANVVNEIKESNCFDETEFQ